MITKKRTIGFLLIVGLLTVGFASVYAKGGNPFDRLEADLANLWAVVTGEGGLDAKVLALEGEIVRLEDLIDSIPEGPEGPPGPSGFGPPDYDSDWRSIGKGATLGLEHGLGTTDLLIYVVGSRGLVPGGIHHKYYGYFSYHTQGVQGLTWEATSTGIILRRGGYDSDWDNVRVYIWIIPFGEGGLLALITRVEELEARIAELEAAPSGLGAPDFDSGWQTLPPGSFGYKDLYFDTSVIYDINNTLVYMEGRYLTSQSTYVVHQIFYGGTSRPYPDGFWWQMYDDHVLIHRLEFDSDADEIRVRIWQLPPQ